jgi:hypothetical protein
MLVLLVVKNWKYKRWSDLQCHDACARFRRIPSIGSKVIRADRHTAILPNESYKRTCGLAIPYGKEENMMCPYNGILMDPNTSSFYYTARGIYKAINCFTCRSQPTFLKSMDMFSRFLKFYLMSSKIRTRQSQWIVRTVGSLFQIPLGTCMSAFSVLFGCPL